MRGLHPRRDHQADALDAELAALEATGRTRALTDAESARVEQIVRRQLYRPVERRRRQRARAA